MAQGAPVGGPAGLELVIFAGLQGSGKSTYYRTRFAATHAHVSKDLMPRSARKKEERQRREVEAALAAGRPVVVDNTNPRRSDREPLIAIGRAHGARVVGYHFTAPVRECLGRNRRREGRARVPDVAILRTAKIFEPPVIGEGYDELHEVRVEGEAP